MSEIDLDRVEREAYELTSPEHRETVLALVNELRSLRHIRDIAWDVTEQVHRNLIDDPEPWFADTLDRLSETIAAYDEHYDA